MVMLTHFVPFSFYILLVLVLCFLWYGGLVLFWVNAIKKVIDPRGSDFFFFSYTVSKAAPSIRDDPDLDKMLKDRLRWGDPMAHLVKVMK